MKYLLLLLVFGLWLPDQMYAQKNILKKILQAPCFAKVLQNKKKHKLQILYTQIDRDGAGKAVLTSYRYGVSDKNYFYPASLVKLPVCALALEKLTEIQQKNPDITLETALQFGANRASQTSLTKDTLSPTGYPHLANYIKRALVVSDNETYNRLYEFLGQGYIQEKLQAKGYARSLIAHRLSRPIYDEVEERHTNPCAFVVDSQQVWQQNAQYNAKPHQLAYQNTRVGKAYFKRGELIKKPYQFKGRSFLPLVEMQKMLQAIVLPETLPATARFQLTDENYAFLRQCLGMYPREAGFSGADNYMKYFLRNNEAPPQIKILNKVGMAFGFLIDNAYIVDLENNTAFLLTVVLYANADETLNDDKYEYETIAKPFMQNLAEAIITYEATRKSKKVKK